VHGLATGIPDPDDPGLAALVTEYPAVAAGADGGVLHTAFAQDLNPTIDRIALGDAAEVDLHLRMTEGEGGGLAIQLDQAVIDGGQQIGSQLGVRLFAGAIVVVATDRGKADVEGAAADSAVEQGLVDQGRQLAGDPNRPI